MLSKNNQKQEKNEKIRVRIAPSPTGLFHIGTARTALFNYLFAKKYQGKFILRIEDTDKERSNLEFEKDILQGLKYLGIKWDEGPYRQSERLDVYKKYIKKLLDENKAYYCFCSKEELEAEKEYQLSRGEPPTYNKKCRNLSSEKIEKNLENKKPFVIRFKTHQEKITFNDLIRGNVDFNSKLIGDIVIAKNPNAPLYNLAVVIDDFEMKITHIIRGEDHISNTPKQILLQKALGLPQPEYAHLPLILGPDKTKLSKRHGAVAVSEYQKQGYLPEALINFMALLGWNPGTEKEIFSIASLIKEFSLKRVQKGGAVFNIERLNWINGFYIRQKSPEKLTKLCLPYLPKNDFTYLEKIVSIHQERLKKLSEISELTDFFFKDKLEYDKSLLRWKEMSDNEIKNSLERSEKIISEINTEDFNKENLKKILMSEAEIMGDRGGLLWPLRIALSGKKASAPPFEIAEILGKEKTLQRLSQAKELI